MKIHFDSRLFARAAVLGVLAVLAVLVVGFLIAMEVRSAVAGPGSAAPAAAPTPVGHAWTELEGHGVDFGSAWAAYLNTPSGLAAEFRLDGSRAVRLEPNATSPNVIEGYNGNTVTAGAYGAAIGGGGASGSTNRATDNYGTVGGGAKNQAGYDDGYTFASSYATVGGGWENTASGYISTVGGGWHNSAIGGKSTVGGGDYNTATGGSYEGGATVAGGNGNTANGDGATVGGGVSNGAEAEAATVGGGWDNAATDYEATVGGGMANLASGFMSTVPGGGENVAAGDFSFAAGRQAKANNQGCFVWGDSTVADVACNSNNGFVVRASGNVWFGTTSAPDLATGFINTSTGAYLSSGGAWTNSSDRNLKDNFTPVDGQQVLAKLADVPITTWNYRAQDASIRHMGPVGQDFYTAFALGESETGIGTVDADGVALAAIQALYELSQEQDARIQTLEEENAGLKARVDDLEARVTALETGAGTSAASAQPALPGLSPWWLALLGGPVVAGLVLAQRRRAGGQS